MNGNDDKTSPKIHLTVQQTEPQPKNTNKCQSTSTDHGSSGELCD